MHNGYFFVVGEKFNFMFAHYRSLNLNKIVFLVFFGNIDSQIIQSLKILL
jgi:hypothetical protein